MADNTSVPIKQLDVRLINASLGHYGSWDQPNWTLEDSTTVAAAACGGMNCR
jgi:hypothetical protein